MIPKLENKHLEEALFHPGDNRQDFKGKIPKKCIIIYDEELTKAIEKIYRIKNNNKLSTFVYDFYIVNGIAIAKMKGIGSPNAVVGFENLIYSGARVFLNIGYAGGLYSQGIFLCTKSIRDEGTSSHYLAHSKYAYPNEQLTKRFGAHLKKDNIDFINGASWTIDAPFRETKKEIVHYSKEGVKTVEMEASALFTVAKCRKVKIASAFVVSDILGDKWEPKYEEVDTKESLLILFNSALNFLK